MKQKPVFCTLHASVALFMHNRTSPLEPLISCVAMLQVKKELDNLEKAEIGNPKTPLNKTPYLSDETVDKINEGIKYAPPQRSSAHLPSLERHQIEYSIHRHLIMEIFGLCSSLYL